VTSLGPHAELARVESVRRIEHLPGEAGRRARASLTDWLFPSRRDAQLPPVPGEPDGEGGGGDP
jgi:hypothetical protein